MISYAPLWDTMKRKGITQYKLIHDFGVSTGTLDTLRKNKSVTVNTLEDLCRILECPVSDIVNIYFEADE